MNDPFQTVVEALERAGCNPKPSEIGVSALCPAHEDRSASLGVSTGSDGRALINCLRGCQTAEVIRTLGLEWRDLFVSGRRGRGPARVTSTRPYIDVVLEQLRGQGIGYRCTDNPRMWVAERCAACGIGRLPVFIHEDDRGRVGVSCAEGCDQVAVLLALSVESLRQAA